MLHYSKYLIMEVCLFKEEKTVLTLPTPNIFSKRESRFEDFNCRAFRCVILYA